MKSCFRLSPLRGHEGKGPVGEGGDGEDEARDKLLSRCLSDGGYGGMMVVVNVGDNEEERVSCSV